MALNNVPLAGQTLNDTRVPINQNFATINTAFGINHITYNDPNQGKHNFVSMPVQAASPATVASEVALFSRTSALSGVPEMAFRRESNGTVIEFTSAGAANNGWTRLPSGILLKWGVINLNNTLLTQSFSVNLSAIGPVYSQVFSAQVSCTCFTSTVAVTMNINAFTTALLTGNKNATGNQGGPPQQGFFLTIGV